ncbi:MAG: 30S ribosomal protein S8 [Candidatus Levybacteria bacterium RIFCSPLOWO2_02_FULL_36_8b]|nr:MAG: 30S ribosomal protein S8 [Candidatus Levybacteria bacterium RIFCSPLOWO2_02_FULL_36_8b]
MNYKIADFIIRIKNAASAKRHEVVLPYSNINEEIGKVLVKERFLEEIKEGEIDSKKVLIAKIAYEGRNPVLTDVSIESKPSLRVYSKKSAINETGKRGLNTAILSTNKGVMTGKEAWKKGVGGELLFKVW